MKKQMLLAWGVLALSTAAFAEEIKVRFHIEGPFCAGCASVLRDSMTEAGVTHLSKIPANAGRGYVIVLGSVEDGELAKVADAVNKAETPHKKQAAPSLAIELRSKLDEKSAAEAIKALESVPGVDAKHSITDVKAGMISVKLAGGVKSLKVDNIVAALSKAGIKSQIVTGISKDAPETEVKERPKASKKKKKSAS